MTDISIADIAYSDSSECYGSISYTASIAVIIISCVLGIIWAVINFFQVRSIKVDDEGTDSKAALVENITLEQRKLLIELGDKIQNVNLL